MKAIITLTLSLLLFGTMLFGQYPVEEKIRPYPAPVKERVLRQRFVCDLAGSAKWQPLHQAMLNPLGEALQIESSGHDPYVMLPPIETPRAGTFSFRIHMKNTMNPVAEIFWATTKEPHTKAENAVRFGFLPDGEWHTYTAEFTTTDPLTHLRFDPGTSAGVAEIAWVELYDVIYGDVPDNPTPWVDPNWKDKVTEWKILAAGKASISLFTGIGVNTKVTSSYEAIEVRFDVKGAGAVVFVDGKAVGEIYPLAYMNPSLPLGGIKRIPFYEVPTEVTHTPGPLTLNYVKMVGNKSIVFAIPSVNETLQCELNTAGDELHFNLQSDIPIFGPVFRPYGEMQQAVLNGVEYLEKGEHSSSTADIETKEHLRFAPNPLDVTWPFMSIVTDQVGFGLLWDDPNTQAVFATPDFILGDETKHHLGLHGKKLSGTLKITPPIKHNTLTDLDELILWAFQKRGLPELPKRFRNDEEQRLLNLAAFEKSCIVDPDGGGWMHAAIPGSATRHFPVMYGSDFVTSIWQLTGKLPASSTNRILGFGGGHLPNPASFFLMGQAEEFRIWKRNESVKLRSEQRADGAFPYKGVYLKGHWEDTASGHCGFKLYQLLYTYQILGEPVALEAALKGLEFANKYSVPRGAQTWELSLHTPDIMGSSRMCMANVWAFEATGEKKYLDHARRWAITGLPFVYFWEQEGLGGKDDPIMLSATTPVFGATNWTSPNWIGLPVQWCGLDYAEACFMLSEHDKTLDWKKIAEGILVTAERMQYPEGPSMGLLPDSYVLATQMRMPFDISPSVLVQQRRRLQGQLAAVAVVVSEDKRFRVVSPYRTMMEGNVAVIEGAAGTKYQILVNGVVRTIESRGVDRIEL